MFNVNDKRNTRYNHDTKIRFENKNINTNKMNVFCVSKLKNENTNSRKNRNNITYEVMFKCTS